MIANLWPLVISSPDRKNQKSNEDFNVLLALDRSLEFIWVEDDLCWTHLRLSLQLSTSVRCASFVEVLKSLWPFRSPLSYLHIERWQDSVACEWGYPTVNSGIPIGYRRGLKNEYTAPIRVRISLCNLFFASCNDSWAGTHWRIAFLTSP